MDIRITRLLQNTNSHIVAKGMAVNATMDINRALKTSTRSPNHLVEVMYALQPLVFSF